VRRAAAEPAMTAAALRSRKSGMMAGAGSP